MSHSFSSRVEDEFSEGASELQIPQGAEVYPGRVCIHPCPEGSAEASVLLQRIRILLVLHERLPLILFIAHQCGSLTAAKADSY